MEQPKLMVYAIMGDLQEDGYCLGSIVSTFQKAKKMVEEGGASIHGDIDIVEWEVDGEEVVVYTLYKAGRRGRKSWTHPKFKT